MDPSSEFRLFIALAIPHEVQSRIAKAQAELRLAVPERAARWTRQEQFHLTLRFLGNIPASQVEKLAEASRLACAPFTPLRLSARTLGFFPNARFPRVLWAGIKDADNHLAGLWKALQSATQPFTKEPAETEFAGHVTLARVKHLGRTQAEELARTAAKFQTTLFGEWTANQVELLRSELLPEGARHGLLAAFPLQDHEH